MGETDTLKKWINESNYIVFFGGAGVSTESNIPDFRSTDGLYHQEYDYPPETILSHSFYMRKPEEFYRFYRNKMLFPNAKPNRAHLALAKAESGHYPEYRRAAPGSRQQRGAGAARIGAPQPLYALRQVLRIG